MNGLDRLPFSDYADPDPDALPFDEAAAAVRDMSGAEDDRLQGGYDWHDHLWWES